uniref:zinc finger protein 91 n=1 Tax=Anopheles coluzzii TaxID=1518534 RepID=UPI0020FFAFD9|nr:zinc finger protein 91 [Anopheles coluzzii]XP_049461650.1 zinc finger protein 91 [Anopheles coluzzii]XP_049461651.1 zinc finger protein 91 [Anopheles coluzzii]
MEPEQEPEPIGEDDPVDVPNSNPETYCRFCFSENEVEPLFAANGTQASAELLQRIQECIGIKLTRKEYCPSAICWSCTLTLEEFQCFRKRCLKFDTLVRRLLPTVKSEPSHRTATPTTAGQKEKKITSKQQPAANVADSEKNNGGPSTALKFKCQFCPRSFKHRMYLDQHLWKHRDRIAADAASAAGAGTKKIPHVNGNGSSAVKIKSEQAAQQKSAEQKAPPAAAHPAGGGATDRPISCEYCPRKFTRRMYYMQHLRRHKPDERLFRCRHCPRSFTSQLRRTGHERKIHGQLSNPKSEQKDTFSCPKCSRVFKHRSSLRMHMLNHDGQLPYGCDICNCRFYSVSYLALHKKRYHGPNAARSMTNGTSIPCHYCSRWFLRECDRSSHIKQMHADMHASKESAAGFNQLLEDCPPADSEGLTDPEMLPPNVHEPMMVIKEEEPDGHEAAASNSVANNPDTLQFYCYSCAMPFDTEDMFSEHLDDQHPFGGEQLMDQLQSASPFGEQQQQEQQDQDANVFKCPYCPKTFTRKWSLTQHLPTHIAKKGYQCEYCPAIFTRNEYLRTHRKRKHPNLPETGAHKCSYCPRMFNMVRYKKVHERIAHIKKGDILPEGDDTESSEVAAINSLQVEKQLDESSNSLAPELPSRASDSFDQASNDAPSVASVHNYADLEASSRLAVVLERLPAQELEQYRWQLEHYASMPPVIEIKRELLDPQYGDIEGEGEGFNDNAVYDGNNYDDEQVEEEDAASNDAEDSFQPDETNDSGKQLLKRKRTKFGITLHPCPHCSKLFKTRTALRLHALYHSGDLPHRCDECGVQFMRYNQLVYHTNRYHGANSATMAARYSCDYCPRIFLRKQDRTTHQLMVHARDQANAIDKSPALTIAKKTKRKDYVCRVCDAEFEKYRRCVRHITLIHAGSDGEPECRPIKLCHCSICSGIYKKRDDWHEHLNDHPSVRPHHCEQCIRRRRKASSRKQVHRCSYCPKAFEHKPNLASHLRIHKQQLRFPCSECGVMYDRYRDLLTHQSRYHPENQDDSVAREPLPKCNFCPRVFTRQRDVKYHQEQVHADQVIPAGDAEATNEPEEDEEPDEQQENEGDGLMTFGFGPEMFPEPDVQEDPVFNAADLPIKSEPDPDPPSPSSNMMID